MTIKISNELQFNNINSGNSRRRLILQANLLNKYEEIPETNMKCMFLKRTLFQSERWLAAELDG